MMYSFVVEDVLKGLFIYVPPGYVACVYDLGQGVLKKVSSFTYRRGMWPASTTSDAACSRRC